MEKTAAGIPTAAGIRDGKEAGMGVTKAVFPVGGLGTRFLPATKAIPKMMSRMMAGMMQTMMAQMRESGCTPSEM